MAAPVSGGVYFIINKYSGLACDLGSEDNKGERFVINLQFNEENSQKWEFTQKGQYWIVKNIGNGKFMDVRDPQDITSGTEIVTDNEREWDIVHDDEFDGQRFFIPQTELNTTGLSDNTVPVILLDKGRDPSQVWELRAVNK